MGVDGHRDTSAALLAGKGQVTQLQGAGLIPGSVWIGAENVDPTGIRSPEIPACSQSLY
jgi:hypothetical protein